MSEYIDMMNRQARMEQLLDTIAKETGSQRECLQHLALTVERHTTLLEQMQQKNESGDTKNIITISTAVSSMCAGLLLGIVEAIKHFFK